MKQKQRFHREASRLKIISNEHIRTCHYFEQSSFKINNKIEWISEKRKTGKIAA